MPINSHIFIIAKFKKAKVWYSITYYLQPKYKYPFQTCKMFLKV